MQSSKPIRPKFIEILLENCPSTSYELHHLFRTVSLVRRPSFKPENLTSFISKCSAITNSNHESNESAARSTVRIAAQIQRLACTCLSKLFKNLRLAHSAILPSEWLESGGSEPFSWIEEFHVYRALWRLQIHSDLQRAVKPEPEPGWLEGEGEEAGAVWGGWNWTPAEIDKIATTYFDDVPALDYEVQGVADVLIELGAKALYTPEQPSPRCQQADASVRNVADPMPLFASLDISTPVNLDKQEQEQEHRHGRSFISTWPWPTLWPMPPIPEYNDLNFSWGRSIGNTEGSTQGTFYFSSQLNLAFRPGLYQTGLDDMRPFYRLGVFIWDSWRMYSMGPLYIRERETQAPDGTFFTPSYPGRLSGHLIRKRWCALIGRAMGGKERIQRQAKAPEARSRGIHPREMAPGIISIILL